MLNVTVVQPPCFMGENPDEKIADFLIDQLQYAEKASLIVLPDGKILKEIWARKQAVFQL